MWKPRSNGLLQSIFNSTSPYSRAETGHFAPELESAVTQNERLENARRLYKVEQYVVMCRFVGMLGWAGMIAWEGIPFGFNFTWVSYLVCFFYCLLLHVSLQKQKYLLLISWVGTLGDPIVAFMMCLSLGKSSSVFIPFFYFTMIAATFRHGGKKSVITLFFTVLLIILLFLLDIHGSNEWKNLAYVLLFLGYAYMFGSLMSEWALSNLRKALLHSQELEKERDRSQELLHRLINTQEVERKKLAEDLHDRSGERFFSICHGLDGCIRNTTDDGLRNHLNSLRLELLEGASDIRFFMNELRPTVLDDLGLYETILEYATTLKNVVPFSLTVNLDPALRAWRSKEDTMLFRLVQEALLNARKHSHAKSVLISLQKRENSIALFIEDDGRGFDTAITPAGHFGLLTMRERAVVSGGVMSIESKPQKGTTVLVRFDIDG